MPKPLEGIRVMDPTIVILSGKSFARRTKAKNLTSSLGSTLLTLAYGAVHKEVLRGQGIWLS